MDDGKPPWTEETDSPELREERQYRTVGKSERQIPSVCDSRMMLHTNKREKDSKFMLQFAS